MQIEINEDIDKFQESVMLGLTAKQLVFSIMSVAVGGSIVLLTYRYIGLTGSAYVAIPAVAPIALTGFYSYHGMGFMEVMKKRLKFAFANRALLYHSTDNPNDMKKIRVEEQLRRKREEKKKSKNKKTKKNK